MKSDVTNVQYYNIVLQCRQNTISGEGANGRRLQTTDAVNGGSLSSVKE
jgi:hypothetical protein